MNLQPSPLPDQRIEHLIELQEKTNKLLEAMLELLKDLKAERHIWRQ